MSLFPMWLFPSAVFKLQKVRSPPTPREKKKMKGRIRLRWGSVEREGKVSIKKMNPTASPS